MARIGTRRKGRTVIATRPNPDEPLLARALSLDVRRVPVERIPVIDLAPMRGDDHTAIKSCTDALDKACREVGFFYIFNHGVAAERIETLEREARRFFAQPRDLKMALDFRDSEIYGRGYMPMGRHLIPGTADEGDLHEAFEFSLELPDDDPDRLAGCPMYGPNRWPADLPGFREPVYGYYEAIRELGRDLFRAFALALDLPEGYFEPMISKPLGQMRLIHYPPDPSADAPTRWGIGPHTDYECFTILLQDDVGGLELMNAEGEWIAAPPIADTFVVNVGDMMARWTNDLYASTLHRVVNRSGRERYSFPFFYGANFDAEVRCLPTCCDDAHPAKYPPTTAGVWAVEQIEKAYGFPI
jgi:isopenicillin N synthase-like dioxygenase